MPSKTEKTRRAYAFFIEAERNNRLFTLEDVARESGWTLGTVRTYRTKNWHLFLKEEGGKFRSIGISEISEDAFIRLQSQRASLELDSLRPRFTSNVDALIDKAREAALLAVQVYNNPLVQFRSPGYIVQMIIAYTALFHAVFERDGIEYWYRNPDGSVEIVDGDKKAWEIHQCVRHYYKGQTLPEVANLEFAIKIRNKIEHRFLPALDITFAGKCQALLLNFEELLSSEFGSYFALGANLALALQFSVYSEEQQIALRKIQSDEYHTIREYSDAYDALLPQEVIQSMKYSFRAYLIPKLGNHASSADIAIEFVHFDPNNEEEMKRYHRQVAFIRDRQIPVANRGHLRPTAVVERVKEKTGIDFTMFHHTNAWKMYNVRPTSKVPHGCRAEYCHFDEVFREFVYTDRWVNFLCEKITDPDEFESLNRYRRTVSKQ